jgi:hypothetical protein
MTSAIFHNLLLSQNLNLPVIKAPPIPSFGDDLRSCRQSLSTRYLALAIASHPEELVLKCGTNHFGGCYEAESWSLCPSVFEGQEANMVVDD